MLRDLINHDSLPSVRKKKKKKLIRASHVFKDPPVFPHIGGKLCALTSENGTVQVHYVRRNTVHSLAHRFCFRETALKYTIRCTFERDHISNVIFSPFFLDSSRTIYPRFTTNRRRREISSGDFRG